MSARMVYFDKFCLKSFFRLDGIINKYKTHEEIMTLWEMSHPTLDSNDLGQTIKAVCCNK